MVIEDQRAISASATAFGHSDPAALSVNSPLPGARQPFWRRRRALSGGVALDVTEVRSAPAQPIRERRLCILFPSTFFYSPEMLGLEPRASRMIDSAVALSDIPKPSIHLLLRCRISADVFLPMCIYFELPNKGLAGKDHAFLESKIGMFKQVLDQKDKSDMSNRSCPINCAPG